MEKINKEFLKVILGEIVNVLKDEKDYLTQLDAAMGDGDLGITMTKGFQSIYDELDKIETEDMGKIFMKLGMKMNLTVPSTMAVTGISEISLKDAVNMGRAAVKGVIERGKTKVGNKTMLDALQPAVESLAISLDENKTLSVGFEKAYEAAQNGVEKTKDLKPVHGRAAYYQEKSLGTPDPGAVAVMYIFKGIKKAFNK
ncbi:dihydroxyacetone kinase subunit L [Clostridium sp.]|uniref:dihydroxyacetone kinase subunit L n=1 Tax=Clostridium sp. TaxID=1506 RepID=UPI003D6CD99C